MTELSLDERAALRRRYEEIRLFPGPAKDARDVILRLLDALDRVHIQEPLRGPRRAAAVRVPLPPPASDELWASVGVLREWLDTTAAEQERDPGVERVVRVLKVNEEAGEAARAYIRATGHNPRGNDATMADVLAELADTAVAAMIAMATFDKDAPQILNRRLKATVARVAPAPEVEEPVGEEEQK